LDLDTDLVADANANANAILDATGPVSLQAPQPERV
jgi:hypothetical protein